MMRILYKTEAKKGEEFESIDKIIETNHVTFYNLTQKIEVGNRLYTFVEPNPEEDGPYTFDDFKQDALQSGSMDLRDFEYEIVENKRFRGNSQPQQQRNNYRRNGGYRPYYGRR